GLPFFEPLYGERNSLKFYASSTTRSSFHELFFGLQRRANLPVPRAALCADVSFESIQAGETFKIENKVKISTFQLNHQGVTLAYRLEYRKDSVCIITDTAPIENGNYLGEGMRQKASGRGPAFEQEFIAGLTEFLKGAHTVVFDTHFT